MNDGRLRKCEQATRQPWHRTGTERPDVDSFWCPTEQRWTWCPGSCPTGEKHTADRVPVVGGDQETEQK